MCSIVGSFNKDLFISLIEKNSDRGSFSHSLSIINPADYTSITYRDWGPFNPQLLDKVPSGFYMLGHCQAPTNGLVEDFSRIHPYVSVKHGTTYKLLHNGIITPESMRYINNVLCTEYQWDTQGLTEFLIEGEPQWDKLDLIKGSFTCGLLIEGKKLYFFKNQIAPLFINTKTLDISSVYFNGAAPLLHNYVFNFDLQNVKLRNELEFNNKYSPFFFA
jgi:hypothetical protein